MEKTTLIPKSNFFWYNFIFSNIFFCFIYPAQIANYFHYCNKWRMASQISKNLQFLVLLLHCVKLYCRIISSVRHQNLDNATSIFWVYMSQVQHILLRWIQHKRLFYRIFLTIKPSPIIIFFFTLESVYVFSFHIL